MADLIAVYPSVTEAREALTQLERKGIEAGNIELLGPGMEGAGEAQTNEEMRATDMAVTGKIGRRGAAGWVLGAIVGALVLMAASAVADALFDVGDNLAQVLVGAAVGGALLGGAIGAFWGGATGLPVNDAWGETFEAVKGGKTVVAVHSDDPQQLRAAEEAIRHTKPLKVTGGTAES